jgi:hypothetical protein
MNWLIAKTINKEKNMRRTVMMGLMAGLVIAVTLGLPQAGGAQESTKDQHSSEASKTAEKMISVYRLEFVVRELEDGKKINSRSYTMSVQDGDTGRIRVGNRIPYNTGKDQFQYFEVGINIDCRLHDHGSYILLEGTSIEISSIVKDESSTGGTPNPIVRQARSSVAAAITPGKPTVITSLDDVSSNRRYEVEVTATKVK